MMFGKRNKPYIYVHIIFWGDFTHEKNISHDSLRRGARERWKWTYKGCLGGGCAIWALIGRGGRCCSGREGGWGRSLQSPRGGGGDYAAP